MNYLTLPMLKDILKKKESWLALLFAGFPLLLVVTSLFNTNFMQLSAPANSMDYLTFLGAAANVGMQTGIPLFLFAYISIVILGDERRNGIMYLYKDIKRHTIFRAKTGGLLMFQGIYWMVTVVACLVTYYGYIIHQDYASKRLVPMTSQDMQDVILLLLGTVLTGVIYMLLFNLVALTLSRGLALAVSIVCIATIQVAPLLDHLKYITVNGYVNLLGTFSFTRCLVMMLVLFLVYTVSLYAVSASIYKKLDY